MTHKCPGPGCEAEVDPRSSCAPRAGTASEARPPRRLYRVEPRRGRGTPAHRAAMAARGGAVRREVSPASPSSTRPAALP